MNELLHFSKMHLSLIFNSSPLNWNGISSGIPAVYPGSILVWFNIFINFGDEIESMHARFVTLFCEGFLVILGDKNEEKKYFDKF